MGSLYAQTSFCQELLLPYGRYIGVFYPLDHGVHDIVADWCIPIHFELHRITFAMIVWVDRFSRRDYSSLNTSSIIYISWIIVVSKNYKYLRSSNFIWKRSFEFSIWKLVSVNSGQVCTFSKTRSVLPKVSDKLVLFPSKRYFKNGKHHFFMNWKHFNPKS